MPHSLLRGVSNPTLPPKQGSCAECARRSIFGRVRTLERYSLKNLSSGAQDTLVTLFIAMAGILGCVFIILFPASHERGTSISIVPSSVIAPPTETTPEIPLPVPGASSNAYLVGRDITPGVYRAVGGLDCTWEIDRGLWPGEDAIRERHVRDGAITAVILPGDVLFRTDACGVWSPQSQSRR